MGLAEYAVVEHGDGWTILHDGETTVGALKVAMRAAALPVREAAA